MPRHRKDIDVEAVVSMYVEGATLAQIAERYGIASVTVKRYLVERGVSIRKPGPRDAAVAQAGNRRLSDEQEQEIARRYLDGEFAQEIVDSLDVGRKTVALALRRQGVQTRDKQEAQAHLNRRRRAKGERNPNFKGGRLVTQDGYVLVSIDETDSLWPMAKERRKKDYVGYIGTGYVLEHRLVMARHLGRPLLPEETVHHKNGKRDDNRLSNLELWSSRHAKGQRVKDLRKFAKEILALYPD